MTASPQAHQALQKLLRTLTLEPLEDNLFRGHRASEGWQRVYGGLVLGQAVVAAALTVDESRAIHSLHGYFLLAGDPEREIVYDVERVRDGGSFTTRRVRAIQHGRTIFVMSASFHKPEPGYEHQSEMPDVPPPEALPSVRELFDATTDIPDGMRAYWQRERPIDVRIIDASRYMSREPRPPRQSIWLKSNGPLGDNPYIHQALLAYASDFTLLDTALVAHGKLLFDADIQLASLDHAMWFHRPFRADDWLLYTQDSPSASAARAYCRGSVFDRNGRLVASTVQEGLMRPRETAFVPK
ncbi:MULTISPECIES: acyl-CoA thioesterase II [unclassified Hyphomicrobium]|uniref:acyl-CoA thioesterase II n=1 Tax=unclassified Hyphomicrobium TaxID=2619925 RepID=UPI000213EBAA|nr:MULTISPECIES: acyl-CoA thioesterase II [unclassified Hyphomicrobium]CCB67823.1 acyl-CoA thioesterase II [Hyphomicrobium sp. MC1]